MRSTWWCRRCPATGSRRRPGPRAGTWPASPRAFTGLMGRLGYGRYGAQGGDWGAQVTTRIGVLDPEHCAAIHLNMPVGVRPSEPETLTDEEQADLADMGRFTRRRGCLRRRAGDQAPDGGRRPRRLAGRPAGLDRGEVPWLERLRRRPGDVLHAGPAPHQRDALLAHPYGHVLGPALLGDRTSSGVLAGRLPFVEVPTGVGRYPKEVLRWPRSWVERQYNVTRWVDMPRGGHFAAMEQPELFADDLRRSSGRCADPTRTFVCRASVSGPPRPGPARPASGLATSGRLPRTRRQVLATEGGDLVQQVRLAAQGGEVAEQEGQVALLGQPRGQGGRTPQPLPDRGVPTGRTVGDGVEGAVVGQHHRCGPPAPPGQSGKAVGRVADQGQPVGDRTGATPNLAHTPSSSVTTFFRRSSCTTRPPTTHCARSLSGVQMITRPTAASSAATAAAEARASSASSSTMGHTVSPIAATAASQEFELCEQLGFDALPGLVAGPEVVAERLDDVVRGHAHMGGASEIMLSSDRRTPRTAPISSPVSDWRGGWPKYWRNSSYVPSTRCTSMTPSLAVRGDRRDAGARAARGRDPDPASRVGSCSRSPSTRLGLRRPTVRHLSDDLPRLRLDESDQPCSDRTGVG